MKGEKYSSFNNVKKYIIPVIVFSITIGLGALLHFVIRGHLEATITKILHRLFLAILSLVIILLLIEDKRTLFRVNKYSNSIWLPIVVILGLFMVNNYFHAAYSQKSDFIEPTSLVIVLVSIVANSLSEEFMYRGVIQGYIDQSVLLKKKPISQGNMFASILMLLTHLGFWGVMDTVFAITGLALVLGYSLVAGYIRSKGVSIWWLVVLHTIVNLIHLLFNYSSYVK